MENEKKGEQPQGPEFLAVFPESFYLPVQLAHYIITEIIERIDEHRN